MSQYLSQADLVIEGKVLDETYAVRNEETGSIETVHTIQIDQVFKGNTSSSFVEVSTPGGELDGEISTSSHGSTLSGGLRGIFLLSPNSTNGYSLQGGNAGKITRLKFDDHYEVIHWGELDRYKSWRQLREQVGVLLGIDLSIHALTASEVQSLINDKEFCVKLDNPVPNIEDMTVEFDVMAKSSVPGLKFARAEVIIDYPTGNLGDFIVDQEKIEAGKGDITDGPAYTIALEDKSEDQIELSIESPCNNNDPHYVLDTVYEKLATLTLEVNEWGDFGTLNVNDFSVAGIAEYVNPPTLLGTPGCTEFDDLCGEGEFDFLPCTVTSITPSVVNGGVDDFVEIRGTDFGPGPGAHFNIPNADVGGLADLKIDAGLSRIVTTWNDSLIRFNVTSLGDLSSADDKQPPFGSGEITIYGDTSSLSCKTSLEIKYSVTNVLQNGVDKFYPLSFFLAGNPTGKYQIYLDSSFATSQPFINNGITLDIIEDVLEDALCQWETEANIDFDYKGRALPGNPQLDNRNFLLLGADSQGPIMDTKIIKTSVGCQEPNFGKFVRHIRTYVKPIPNWWAGAADSIPPNGLDFYTTLLHEIGHALGNAHVNDLDTLNGQEPEPGNQFVFDDRFMYFSIQRGKHRRSLDANAINGANRQILETKSRLTNNISCLSGSGIDDSADGCSASSVESVKDVEWDAYINKYGLLTVSCKDGESAALYDMLGRQVNREEFYGNEVVLDVSILPVAVYVIVIRSKNGRVVSGKIMKY